MIVLAAKDCSPFDNQEYSEAIQYFISIQRDLSVFFMTPDYSVENLELAYFDNREAKWFAGRFVGEAFFKFNEEEYKVVIKPRFGELQLFRMLEEIFNIKVTKSKTLLEKQNEYQFVFKQLIAFLWLNMLSKANKHGLPRLNKKREHKGTSVKGRWDLRKSIYSLYTEEKIVSVSYEKAIDLNIVNILFKAYKILKQEYNLSGLKMNIGAKNAIEQILSSNVSEKFISEYDFRNLRYKDIYLTYKPVVQLSWDIIKSKNFGNEANDKSNNESSFFIDMAEVWENYLREILKKKLHRFGWKLEKERIKAYNDMDFRRVMIPDIIFKKNNDVLVLDAKYKRMRFKYYDYDRADFFQIHTYMNYLHQKHNVIAGGLLYPISEKFDRVRQDRNISKTLFSLNKVNTSFVIDGIEYTEIDEESILHSEKIFLDRIYNLISK